jgi:hypothetical protein
MSEKLPFGPALAAIRQEQGYKTPYAFFRGRGGQRGLGLTFANYLRFERGTGLPKGWRLKKLISALDLMPRSEKSQKLVRAYLVSVLGSEELLGEIVGEAAGGAELPAGIKMALSTATEAISRTKVQLDLEQYRAVGANPVAYACHVILCNTDGGLTIDELVKTAAAPAAAVKKALKELAAAKLVKLSGTRARSTLEKNYVAPPAPTPAMSAVYAKLQAYRRDWLDRSAAVHTPYLILRASRAKLERYHEHLTEAINMSSIFGDIRPEGDTEMFLVEGRVTRLFQK